MTVIKSKATLKVKRAKSKLSHNKVGEVMKKKEMCAQELADLIETTPAHVSKIMSQQRLCLSLPIGLKIAKALNTPVEQLFFLETKK